jgi:long-chain fatty acid transport protein
MIASNPVAAGGLYVWEFGHPAQGASGAGAGALAQDASTALLNSAGIMFLDESDTMASAIVIDSSVRFRQDPSSATGPTSVTDSDGNRPAHNGGNAGSTAVGATFFHARPVNEKWGWGVSMVSISGAALEYQPKQDFVGRYWASEVELLTINLTPSLAYRVNDEFSIGFAVPIMFGMLDMDVAIPGPLEAVSDGRAIISDGEDILATISLSAMWQPTPALRLGAMYLGEMEIEFDSDLELNPPLGVDAQQVAADVAFTYPQTVRTWGAYELDDRITLLGTLAWEDWSAFDSIAISTPVVGASLPRNWEDTWHLGAGLRIKTDGPWTWHTGVAYDSDPTRALDRTADMPIDRQWRYSVGADRHRENGHRFGLVVTYADYGDADIDNGGVRPGSGIPWSVTGSYATNRLVFLGFNYGW